MISDPKFVKDLKKIVGTQDMDSHESGTQEAVLLKVNTAKIDDDGWYIRINALGEETWAFNSFDFGEAVLLDGNKTNNIIIFNEEINVLVTQDNNKENWRIIKGLSKVSEYNLLPGTKVIKMGNSEIRITSERIDINTPELYLNGEKIS